MRGQIAHLADLRHVAAHGHGVAALVGDGVDGQVGGGLVDVATDDAPAAACEFDGERRPDAAASTGDHRVRAMAAFGRHAEHRYPVLSSAKAVVLSASATKDATCDIACAASGASLGSAWNTCT